MYNGMDFISHEFMMKAAPSVFNDVPYQSLTDRYSVIPTIDIITKLETEGWFPMSVQEQRVRTEDRKGFQKHLVKLRNINDLTSDKEIVPEVLLYNSHDGTSSYRISCGLYRFVCLNGLVVSDGNFGEQKIRHSHNVMDDVIEGVYRVVKDVPQIMESVNDQQNTILNNDEELAFAKAALAIRYENTEESGFTPKQLLTVRRVQDAGNSLWTVFNKVQENLLKGGAKGKEVTEPGKRRASMRKVTGIDSSIGLNRALWTLAEEMRKLKSE